MRGPPPTHAGVVHARRDPGRRLPEAGQQDGDDAGQEHAIEGAGAADGRDRRARCLVRQKPGLMEGRGGTVLLSALGRHREGHRG